MTQRLNPCSRQEARQALTGWLSSLSSLQAEEINGALILPEDTGQEDEDCWVVVMLQPHANVEDLAHSPASVSFQFHVTESPSTRVSFHPVLPGL